MKRFATLSCLVALFAATGCGSGTTDSKEAADSANEARTDSAPMDQPAAAAAEEDAKFAVEAANGGMAEVQLGQLAQEKGSAASVKEFGKMMVDDHSKANETLKTLANTKNITLPAAPGEDKQKVMTDLSAKTGKDFDKAYIDEMVKDHEKDVKLFEDAQQKVKDPDMRQFIENTLPVLRAHMDHINKLKQSYK